MSPKCPHHDCNELLTEEDGIKVAVELFTMHFCLPVLNFAVFSRSLCEKGGKQASCFMSEHTPWLRLEWGVWQPGVTFEKLFFRTSCL